MLATSFTNSNAVKSNTVKVTSKDTSNPQLSPIGDLHILWVKSAEFKNLKGKIFLIFRFLSNSLITLNIWPIKGRLRIKYYSKPTIQLNVSKQIGIAYLPGTYFANVLLFGRDIKKIKDSISVTKKSYVVFIPFIKNDQICYDIALTDDDPDQETKGLIFTDKIVTANPSPPRKYTY